jgi:hypothetical protein
MSGAGMTKPSKKTQQISEKAHPVAELFAALSKAVPNEEWAKVPSDLSKNVDHYLYGAVKTNKPAK